MTDDRFARLERRLARIERNIAVGGPLIGAIADAVPQIVRDVNQADCVVSYNAAPFDAEKLYPRGAAITHGSTLWIATRNLRGNRPGDDSGAWRLAVKTPRSKGPHL